MTKRTIFNQLLESKTILLPCKTFEPYFHSLHGAKVLTFPRKCFCYLKRSHCFDGVTQVGLKSSATESKVCQKGMSRLRK